MDFIKSLSSTNCINLQLVKSYFCINFTGYLYRCRGENDQKDGNAVYKSLCISQRLLVLQKNLNFFLIIKSLCKQRLHVLQKILNFSSYY